MCDASADRARHVASRGVPAKVTPRRHLGSSAAVVLPQRHESVPTHADETSVGLPADVRHRGDAIGVRRVERLDAVAAREIPHATLPAARARHETTAVIVERRARQMRRGVRVAIGGVGVVRARVGAGFVRDRARGYAVVVALAAAPSNRNSISPVDADHAHTTPDSSAVTI